MIQPKDIIIGSYTLEEILERHERWVLKYKDRAERAILPYANLSNVDLHCANLRGIDLCGANLRNADLHGATLCDANLYGVDFRNANLTHVNFYNADLSYANFYSANLCDAYLGIANLRNAEFVCANLPGTVLYNAEDSFIEYRKGKILTQNIIGYKKCIGNNRKAVIVTLEIPRGAIVFSINGHKFRTNKAKVIGLDGADRAMSYYQYMTYYIGDEFTIYNFNCEYNIECGAGIHFFMTREAAENYAYC